MKAIRDTGNQLVAALDSNDSVGIIDSYFPDADFSPRSSSLAAMSTSCAEPSMIARCIMYRFAAPNTFMTPTCAASHQSLTTRLPCASPGCFCQSGPQSRRFPGGRTGGGAMSGFADVGLSDGEGPGKLLFLRKLSCL